MASIASLKPEYHYWGAQEVSLFAATLISLFVGGTLTSCFYHAWGSYCYLGVGGGSLLSLACLVILICKEKDIPDAWGIKPSHLKYLSEHIDKIGKREKVENITYLDVGPTANNRVFTYAHIADYVFKLRAGDFLENVGNITIKERHDYIERCRRFCDEEGLSSLYIPQAKVVQIGKHSMLVEKKISLAKHMEVNLATACVAKMEQAVAELLLLITTFTIGDMVHRNIALLEENGKMKIALFDIEHVFCDMEKEKERLILFGVLFDDQGEPKISFIPSLHHGYLLFIGKLLGFSTNLIGQPTFPPCEPPDRFKNIAKLIQARLAEKEILKDSKLWIQGLIMDKRVKIRQWKGTQQVA